MPSGRKSGYKPVQIPEPIYNLLQRAIDEHKATNLSDAVNHGICAYLGVTYQPMSLIRAKEEITKQIIDLQSLQVTVDDIRKTGIHNNEVDLIRNDIPEDF